MGSSSSDLEGETAVDMQLGGWKKCNEGKFPFGTDWDSEKKAVEPWVQLQSSLPLLACEQQWGDIWNICRWMQLLLGRNGNNLETNTLCLVDSLALAA